MLTKKGKLDKRIRRICFQTRTYTNEQLCNFAEQYKENRHCYEYKGEHFKNYYIVSACEDEIKMWNTNTPALIMDFNSKKKIESFMDYLHSQKRAGRIDEILKYLDDNPS